MAGRLLALVLLLGLAAPLSGADGQHGSTGGDGGGADGGGADGGGADGAAADDVAANGHHGRLAHGTYLPHVQLVEAELAPAESRNWTLAFEGAAMPAGWHWLIRADVQGTVQARLDIDGMWSVQWPWGEGQQAETAVLGATGHPRLTLRNLGQENATVAFYYDHTCQCPAKAAPLSPGMLWLDVDAEAGDEVRMRIFVQPVQDTIDGTDMPATINVTARYLLLDEFGGYVPQERVQRTFRTDTPFCDTAPTRWNGCLHLNFTALHSGRQLVRAVTEDDAATWKVLLVPYIEVGPRDEASPMAILPAILALAVAAMRRR